MFQVIIDQGHPLFGPFQKIERAGEHLDQLDAEIALFSEHAHRVIDKIDLKQGRHSFRIEPRMAPPATWGVTVAEIVHHLRSALDNIVWQLALRYSGDAPYDRTQFPVFRDESEWAHGEIDRLLQSISPYAKRMIERMQPYHAGDRAEKHVLWILHSLWNIDKHQTLIDMPLSIEFRAPNLPGVERAYFKNGGIEVSMPIRLAREMHFKPQITIEVGFQREGPVAGSTTAVLRAAHDVVRNRILPVLSGFVPRSEDTDETPVDADGRLILPEGVG